MPYIDTKYIGDCNYCRHHRTGSCDTWCECGECFQPDMTKIPLADVVEVVHGYWIPTPMKNNECSLCHDRYHFTYPYCPSCGAKMDGKRKDDASNV